MMIDELFDSTVIAHVFAILVLICFSAFFSGSETALTSASKGKLKSMAARGNRGAERALVVTSDPDRLISGILLGNNFVNILATALATSLFSRLMGDSGIAIATLVMTALLLVFAEILPKTYALARSEWSASFVSSPVSIFITMFTPIVYLAKTAVRGLLMLAGVRITRQESTQDIQDEIVGRVALGVSEGMYSQEDLQRVLGALDIHNRTVENVMLHRSGIMMLNADDPVGKILEQCIVSPHSRLPVYKNEYENIIKVAHVRDIYRMCYNAAGNGGTGLEDMDWVAGLKAPYFVPETTSLGVQMREFLARRTHFALVVDEYGALQGLVTLEDILEEIVGEIADEYDRTPDREDVRPGNDEMVVDGATPVHELNKTMGWNLPESHANTVAGLIIHEIRYIPQQGECFNLFGFEFSIIKRERNRIARVMIIPGGSDTE